MMYATRRNFERLCPACSRTGDFHDRALRKSTGARSGRLGDVSLVRWSFRVLEHDVPITLAVVVLLIAGIQTAQAQEWTAQ